MKDEPILQRQRYLSVTTFPSFWKPQSHRPKNCFLCDKWLETAASRDSRMLSPLGACMNIELQHGIEKRGSTVPLTGKKASYQSVSRSGR